MQNFYITDEGTLNQCDQFINQYQNSFLVTKREFYLDDELNLCHLDEAGCNRLIAIPLPMSKLSSKLNDNEPLFIVKANVMSGIYELTEAFKLQTDLEKQEFKNEFLN